MVLKTAAKNHQGFMNGTIDKGHGFLRKDIMLRYFKVHYGKIVMFVTVYVTGEQCIYLKAFRWSYKISRKGRGDSTWVHVSRAEDWPLLQPNAHKALSGYQGCTPDSGLLYSCIPAQTRAWKREEADKKHTALRYTNLQLSSGGGASVHSSDGCEISWF